MAAAGASAAVTAGGGRQAAGGATAGADALSKSVSGVARAPKVPSTPHPPRRRVVGQRRGVSQGFHRSVSQRRGGAQFRFLGDSRGIGTVLLRLGIGNVSKGVVLMPCPHTV